jgi:hypothetical protein
MRGLEIRLNIGNELCCYSIISFKTIESINYGVGKVGLKVNELGDLCESFSCN